MADPQVEMPALHCTVKTMSSNLSISARSLMKSSRSWFFFRGNSELGVVSGHYFAPIDHVFFF